MKRNVKILSRDRSWKKSVNFAKKKPTLTDGLPNTVLLKEEIFRLVHKREMRRNPEEQKNREKKTKREILEWGSEEGGRERKLHGISERREPWPIFAEGQPPMILPYFSAPAIYFPFRQLKGKKTILQKPRLNIVQSFYRVRVCVRKRWTTHRKRKISRWPWRPSTVIFIVCSTMKF